MLDDTNANNDSDLKEFNNNILDLVPVSIRADMFHGGYVPDETIASSLLDSLR